MEARETIEKGSKFLFGFGHFVVSNIICLVIVGLVVFSFIKIFNSSHFTTDNSAKTEFDGEKFDDMMDKQFFYGNFELVVYRVRFL